MEPQLFQYFGMDWIAMVLTMLAIWQIGNKNIAGFYIMMTGNVFWVILGVLTGSVALVIANAIFIGMNIRAIMKWSSVDTES